MPNRNDGESWADYARRVGFATDQFTIEALQGEERARRNLEQEARGVLTVSGSTGAPSAPNQTGNWSSVNWPEAVDANTPPPRLRRLQEMENSIENRNTPADKPARMTPERERALSTALSKYYNKAKNFTELPRRGRREGEYHNLIKNQKRDSMTVEEIVNTEIPIQASEVSGNKVREIANVVRHRDIRGDGINTHIGFVCAKTGVQLNAEYAFFFAGRIYGVDSLPEKEICLLCNDLREGCKQVTTFDGRQMMVCVACIKGRNTCRQCSAAIGLKYVEARTCQKCIDAGTTKEPTRPFSHSLKWVGNDLGDIVRSKRMYSCEVEALSPLSEWGYALCRTLPKEMGVATDGSVEAHGERIYGFEVQTPRLSGKKGEELMARMSASLKAIGATINETCGMHIHLDGKDIILPDRKEYPAALIQLFKAYIVFEDVVTSFLPYSRRRNDYCRPLAETFQLGEVENLRSIADVEKLWYQERTYHEIRAAKNHHYHSSRYFGTNLNSLLSHGHLEIRFHSGTMNPKKILEWANLHALIMDACVKRVFTVEFLQEARSTSMLSEKTHMLFEAIGLAESSRQYLRSRQKKFGDKKNDDEEVKFSKKKMPHINLTTAVRAQTGRIRLDRTAFAFADSFNGIIGSVPSEVVVDEIEVGAEIDVIDRIERELLDELDSM